jgi:RNA polymerase sigma-70 factor (ECF subfamily)
MDETGMSDSASDVQTDDASLLRAYIERADKEAMSELFCRHADAAFRLALRCTNNAADAEDAVQAAFLNVMRCAVQFRAESSARVWIMGFIVNACRDRAKAEKIRKNYESRAADFIPPGRDADDAEKELQDAALSAVNSLPKIYRLPVWLHYLEGLSFKDVSEVLALPENTVRSQANRGVEQLRQALAGAGFVVTAAQMPVLLSTTTLPAAPVALKASLKAIATGTLKTGAGAAIAPKALAASLKLVIASVVVIATGATAIHFAAPSGPTQTATPAMPVPHGSNETRDDGKEPAAATPAWPAGKVVGWRGDGTGRYPDANPPTTWSRKENGEKTNIAWETKLPCYTWSTPVIVGDRIFTRAEPYDLICLNKMTGKLLWIRSHPPFIAVSTEEKKANPAFNEIEPLMAELQKVNDGFVAQGWTAALYAQKYGLQKKINDLTAKADKKYKFGEDKYVESWAGYTGQTPFSDGQFIYFTSGDGISACYDLEGNKKWAVYEPLSLFTEHGHGWSPALFGDKFVVPLFRSNGKYEMMALNKASGEIVRKQPVAKPHETFAWSQLNLGGTEYGVIFGNLFRVSDGKAVEMTGLCTQTVADGDMLYSIHNTGQLTWFKIGNDFKMSLLTPNDKAGYQQLMIPPEDEAKKWESGSNFWVAAPLYHDGLVYAISSWGRLAVADPGKAELLYVKKLPFDFKNPQHRKTFGCGIGASPALGGKYIYMIDSAGCVIVMEPGREYKQVAKNNIDEIVPQQWEPSHNMGAHHEQTEATLIFDGNRIYIRGEQYLYCIADPKVPEGK